MDKHMRIPEEITDEAGDQKAENGQPTDAQQRENSCGKSGCEYKRISGFCHWEGGLTGRIWPVRLFHIIHPDTNARR